MKSADERQRIHFFKGYLSIQQISPVSCFLALLHTWLEGHVLPRGPRNSYASLQSLGAQDRRIRAPVMACSTVFPGTPFPKSSRLLPSN